MALAACRAAARCLRTHCHTTPHVRQFSNSLMDMDISPQMDASQTVVDGWDDYGYKVNGIYMRGSVLCFPSFTLLWDVQQIADVTHESLSPVLMFAPRVRVLLIGTGEEMQNVNPLLYGHFSKQGVAVEHMSSDNAMATFNVLNQEGRPAAAALLSRKPLPRDEACFYANGSADMVQGLAQQSQRSTYDVYDVPAASKACRGEDVASGALEARLRDAGALGGAPTPEWLQGAAGTPRPPRAHEGRDER